MTDEIVEPTKEYFIPGPSPYPIFMCIALLFTMVGAANWIHGHLFGPILLLFGLMGVFAVMFMWFGTVIRESKAGKHNKQLDKTFRWAMGWFIFSEVMFFAVLFGSLYYARMISVPRLGAAYSPTMTHLLLWPNFKAIWPVLTPPNPGVYGKIHSVMYAWGLPAINTLILLTSGATITWAHWALVKHKQKNAVIAMCFTVALGIAFLCCQIMEYGEAYTEKGLKLTHGIFGTTFFMLTGFHGLHVTIGTIMLIVILVRICMGHFQGKNHFAFEAVSWYWHFVDVVWLGLFIFVYWL